MKPIRIDVLCIPFSGHLNPLIQLFTPFLNKKEQYSIRFITGISKYTMVSSLGFSVAPVAKDIPHIADEIANASYQIKNNPLLLYKQARQYASLIPKIVKEIDNLVVSNKTQIIIADSATIPAAIVSKKHNIRWLTTTTTPSVIETPEGTPPYLGGLSYRNDLYGKIRNYLGWQAIRATKRVIFHSVSSSLPSLPSLYDSQGREMSYSQEAIFAFSMSELEYPQKWPHHIRFIGPCADSPITHKSLRLHFQKKKRIFISYGTSIPWSKVAMKRETIALAKRHPDIEFIVSYGQQEHLEIHPLEVVNNISIYNYIPYDVIIPQVDGVIHHGGAGITYNCIKWAKPSIVIPQDYDHFDYAARIVYHGLGGKTSSICSDRTSILIQLIYANNFIEKVNLFQSLYYKYTPSDTLFNYLKTMKI